jgi:hypothetical protein
VHVFILFIITGRDEDVGVQTALATPCAVLPAGKERGRALWKSKFLSISAVFSTVKHLLLKL